MTRHGTIAQAEFHLRSRGEDISEYRSATERLESGLQAVLSALPANQRRMLLDRDQLERFQFAPDDLVVVVGQDGLVANVAKYLDGQLVVGVNPDPARYDGVLCQHAPSSAQAVIEWATHPFDSLHRIEHRTLLSAEREDGQMLLALNELFIGHQTHQSARYRIRVGDTEERQSSSGVICATGTGCTGWALSIARQRQIGERLPSAEDRAAIWLVREPFPSVSTGTSLDHGLLRQGKGLELVSEMPENGVVFADGIETDRLEFADGHRVRLQLSTRRLRLVARDPGHGGSARVRRRGATPDPRRSASP